MTSPISNFLFISYPILNGLVLIYHLFNFLHVPYPLAFSIIGLTVVIRLVLYPLTSAQLKAAKKMQEINPHLSKLKEKHKNDPKLLQAETMKLYKEFGINPAAGCLPLLIQLPVIWALYNVLQDIVKYSPTQINQVLYSFVPQLSKVWDTTFFGIPLAQNPSQLLNTLGPIIILIPVLTGVFQFIQSKMMLPSIYLKKEEQIVKKTETKKDDFASAFQSQSLFIFPIMIGFLSYTFPIGLSLYWNTFTIFGIIQQYKISGLGGLEDYTNILWKKK